MSEHPRIRLLKSVKIGGVVHNAKRVLAASQVPLEHMEHYVREGIAEYVIPPTGAAKAAKAPKSSAAKAAKAAAQPSPTPSPADSESKEP